MGNQHARTSEKIRLMPEELKILECSFKAIGSFKVATLNLSDETLVQAWSSLIDPHLAQCTTNYLLKTNPTSIQLKRFCEPYYFVERGTTDEKVNFLAASLDKTDATHFSIKELENYVASVFRSYVLIQSHLNDYNLERWKEHGYQSTDRTLVSLAKNVTRTLALDGEHRVDLFKLEKWLDQNSLFLLIWREVFSGLYSFSSGKNGKLGRELSTVIIPVLEGLQTGTNYTPILDIPHVIFMNNNLPNEFRHKWRLLFSSKIMGESFSTMLGKIARKGPTVVVVEDEDRYVFAGYAPSSWMLSPLFSGDESSMLFTLSPAMRCFQATGYNDHFQYLNINQQTMPNGLGMGGQFNYWGLWIDCEYGQGHSSESCTTYGDYIQLSKRKDFRIRNLEVFGIGDEPTTSEDDEENQHRSVLDRNLEDRVVLELSGKKMHSEGLREPEET